MRAGLREGVTPTWAINGRGSLVPVRSTMDTAPAVQPRPAVDVPLGPTHPHWFEETKMTLLVTEPPTSLVRFENNNFSYDKAHHCPQNSS